MGMNGTTSRILTFNGIPSSDLNLVVESGDILSSAEYDVEFEEIPGMNGDVSFSKKRFKNKEVTYELATVRNITSRAVSLHSWLFSDPEKYCRLEDSVTPDFYYMAMFLGPADIETKVMRFGKTEIEFTRKPQRFFKIGEEPVTVTTSTTLVNPSIQTALPLIRVYGHGTVNIGDVQVTVAEHPNPYVDIDCERKYSSYQSQRMNQYITLTNHQYPALMAGNTGIQVSGEITRVEITPRWWCL